MLPWGVMIETHLFTSYKTEKINNDNDNNKLIGHPKEASK